MTDDELQQLCKVSIKASAVVVFLCSFICYTNTLTAGFVYDDSRAILKNKDLLPEKPLSNIFYNDFWGTPLSHSGSHKSYRPLCVLTFRLNYHFGKLDPFGYHLFNIILHSLVSSLFTIYCNEIFQNRWLAFVGGLMFATHPIHTEAVAGIVGRADVGSAFFFLLALISYHKAVKEIKENFNASTHIFWFLLCLMSAVCSMFTKELGVTVLGVIVAYEMLIISRCNFASPKTIIRKLQQSGGLWRTVFIIFYAVLILYLRLLVMGHSPPEFAPADNPAANDPNLVTRVLTFLYLPSCNLWLLFYPWNLSYDYSMDTIPLVGSLFSIENMLSVTLYGSLAYIAYLFLKCSHNCLKNKSNNESTAYNAKKKRNDEAVRHQETTSLKKNLENNFTFNAMNIMILSLAAMILPFLPASNMFFYVGFVIAERVLYIPSIGFCLLVVNGLNVLTKFYSNKRKQIVSALSILIIMFALRTYERNYVWKDEESLYRSGLKTSPAKSYGNLANVLVHQNKTREAEEAYRSALKFRRNMADTHYNLGILLQNDNRNEEAILSYKDAINCRPRLAAAHLNLGVTLMNINKKEEALEVLINAYNISDHGLKDPVAHMTALTNIRYNSGRIFYEFGKNKKALQSFFDALDIMPDGYKPHSIYNMLGQVYSALKEDMNAGTWYLKALRSKPNHVPALLAYAKHLQTFTMDAEKLKKAEENFQKALQIDPHHSESYLFYSAFLSETNRERDAVPVLQKLLEFDKNNIPGLTYLSSIYRNLKDYTNAEKYQLKARDLDPTKPDVLVNLGALYHLMGRYEVSYKTYQTALKYDPTNKLLLDNMKRLERTMSRKTK